jgi:hypothetical protein
MKSNFINNKRGMFFTIIAISLIILFLIFYAYQSSFENPRAINPRINTMNGFVFSIEQDLPRQLYIAGYRAIFIFEGKISNEGVYISDINSSFNELFFNGSLNGVNEDIMLGATYSDIKTSIEDMARSVNVNVVIEPKTIRMVQEDPWRIKIILDTVLFIEDSGKLASWNKTGEYYAYIPVDSFEDPLYTVSTSGLVIHKINRTAYNPLVNGNNVGNLSLHTQNGLYISSTLAPSFLDRLGGSSSPNINGIESLVYLPELSAQGITAEPKSCVDYIYFSTQNPAKYNIQGMPSWFYLDSEHLSLYNATSLAY